MARGLGNPYRLMGAVERREREALERLPYQRCTLHPDEPAWAVIETFIGGLLPACAYCGRIGQSKGYRVVWPALENEGK